MELFIFAGPNGSGKSTIINAFIKNLGLTDFEYICPDIYARKLFFETQDEDSYKKAFKFAEYKRNRAVAENKNIIIETVNSTTDKFAFYRECKSRGYRITVVFVCTQSYEINISRVAKRKSQGGHDVPIDKIISRFNKSLDNMLALCLFADVLYLFDNSAERPSLCYYKDENESRLLSEPDWVKKYFLEKLGG